MSERAPDVAGVIVGWRTWRVLHPDNALNYWGSPMLESRGVWPHDGALKADHVNSWQGIGDHAAPDPDCVCGIYAVSKPTDLVCQPGAARPSALLDGRAVAGKVALWGRVIEHEHGWRAEYAQPVALALPPDPFDECRDALLAFQERYGLPSVDDEGLFAALKDAPEDDWGVALGVSVAQFQAAMKEAQERITRAARSMERMAEAGQKGREAGEALRAAMPGRIEYRKSHENHTHLPSGWSYHKGGRP